MISPANYTIQLKNTNLCKIPPCILAFVIEKKQRRDSYTEQDWNTLYADLFRYIKYFISDPQKTEDVCNQLYSAVLSGPNVDASLFDSLSAEPSVSPCLSLKKTDEVCRACPYHMVSSSEQQDEWMEQTRFRIARYDPVLFASLDLRTLIFSQRLLDVEGWYTYADDYERIHALQTGISFSAFPIWRDAATAFSGSNDQTLFKLYQSDPYSAVPNSRNRAADLLATAVTPPTEEDLQLFLKLLSVYLPATSSDFLPDTPDSALSIPVFGGSDLEELSGSLLEQFLAAAIEKKQFAAAACLLTKGGVQQYCILLYTTRMPACYYVPFRSDAPGYTALLDLLADERIIKYCAEPYLLQALFAAAKPLNVIESLYSIWRCDSNSFFPSGNLEAYLAQELHSLSLPGFIIREDDEPSAPLRCMEEIYLLGRRCRNSSDARFRKGAALETLQQIDATLGHFYLLPFQYDFESRLRVADRLFTVNKDGNFTFRNTPERQSGYHFFDVTYSNGDPDFAVYVLSEMLSQWKLEPVFSVASIRSNGYTLYVPDLPIADDMIYDIHASAVYRIQKAHHYRHMKFSISLDSSSIPFEPDL